MTDTVYRKPPSLAQYADKHMPDTYEFFLWQTSEVYGIPTNLCSELTGIPVDKLRTIYKNETKVPGECIDQVERLIDVMEIVSDLQLLPTKDYGTIKNQLALCYSLYKSEKHIESLESQT